MNARRTSDCVGTGRGSVADVTDTGDLDRDLDRDSVDRPDDGSGGDSDGGSDLAAIGRDLADVEVALRRLDDGTYWTDELTGAPLPEALLAERPTARRTS